MKRMLLGVLILFQSCYTVERNCLPFHTGTFEFTQIIKNEMKTSTFTRDSLYEIEQFEGKIDTASIRWVNDCECILTKLNPTSNQEKRPIQIKIISTTQNSYVFEYSLVGDAKNTQRGTIQKIN
ncbi:MAG TPA: hypothetical protein DCR42_04450 [Flavobacteriaceae bacterium]|jgi:hypothetical protein|nr:hypothetical protein [Flavobacteriaceae bacterium]